MKRVCYLSQHVDNLKYLTLGKRGSQLSQEIIGDSLLVSGGETNFDITSFLSVISRAYFVGSSLAILCRTFMKTVMRRSM